MTETFEEVAKRELVTCSALLHQFEEMVWSTANPEYEGGSALAGTALASINKLNQTQLLDLIDDCVASGMPDEAVFTYIHLRLLIGEVNALEFISRLAPVDPLFVDHALDSYWARRGLDHPDSLGIVHYSFEDDASHEPEEEDFLTDLRWVEERKLLAAFKSGDLDAAIALLALGDYVPDEVRKVVRGISPKNKNIELAIRDFIHNYPAVVRPSDVCGLIKCLIEQGLPEDALTLSLKVVSAGEWSKVRLIPSYWRMHIFDLRLLTEPGLLEF